MEPDAAVGRRNTFLDTCAPYVDDAVDGSRIEIGPVAEDDHRSFDVVGERGQAAAKRRPRAALPIRTVDGSRPRLDLVRAENDDDLADLRTGAHALEHRLEQDGLLR